ncbi:MAG: gamma carbonic anhydrase family protein [Planctomycetota bacterium]|jgi:carbonic anhydrase/acetyltransferase-like protein (isoleucine patch superfamily)
MDERKMVQLGGALVASSAVIESDITLGDRVSVWWNAVLRGDDAALTVGEETNIQDLVMVHPDPDAPMVIGKQVTVGHSAVLHGIRIDDRVLIGIGAILLTGSTVGEGAIVAAGAVVRENWHVPPRTLVAGVPARIMRELTEAEIAAAVWRANKYWKTAQDRWNASQR